MRSKHVLRNAFAVSDYVIVVPVVRYYLGAGWGGMCGLFGVSATRQCQYYRIAQHDILTVRRQPSRRS